MARRPKGRKGDSVYLPSLKVLVDVLFQEAYDQEWTWLDLARESGISYSTIHNLGVYKTKYPQVRTIMLIAKALGGEVQFAMTKSRKRQITWTPKVFRVAA